MVEGLNMFVRGFLTVRIELSRPLFNCGAE